VKRAFILAALTAALVVPVATAAQAQGRNQGMAADLLPPHEVSTVIASMGMRPLSRPIWRGDRYVIFAVDRHGQEVRVVLDAHNGQVLAVRPAGRGFAPGGFAERNGAPPQGYGQGYGQGYDQGYAPPPPPGYPPARQAPYDARYGATPPPPPGAAPGAQPPASDEDYFDNDQQQGSLPPPPGAPRAASREAPTGSVPRRVTAVAPKEKPAKDVMPVPRPRPELAKASDPKANDPSANGAKPVPQAAPQAAAKPEVQQPQPVAKDASKDAPKDVVIDPNKPKPEAKAGPKPVEGIRF
jgi:hypothetical protein